MHEAQYAQGTKDFISKFEIALKECNESEYWPELLFEVNCLCEQDFKHLNNNCIELRRMPVSTVTTLKKIKGFRALCIILHKSLYIQFPKQFQYPFSFNITRRTK